MPPSGSELGVAERLAERQRAISVAEFFEKNKHMLGFDSEARSLVTAVKEAVDNSLDAAEEAEILPDIYVEISTAGSYYTIVVEDNGPGITKEQIPKIFGKMLYGSRFHSRRQGRGQQGLGISAAVLYAQLTSGNPARITSRPKGANEAQYFEVIIDTDENEPDIRDERVVEWDRPHGTRIELDMEANLRARTRLHDYIEQTAIVNPHARIELHEPKLDEPRTFERVTQQLPAETSEIRPHPHGVELGTLIKMLEATDSYSVSGFLQGEFSRVGRKTADEVIAGFMDHHAGRELAWSPPMAHEDLDLEAVLTDAVANKGRQATAQFAERVVDAIADAERVSHQHLVVAVADAADAVEAETDRRFGETVRENAVEAAWSAIAADDRLADDLYRLVDGATTDRKSDRVKRGFAERLADRIRAADRARHRFTRSALVDLVGAAADATEAHDDATFGDTARENVLEAIWSSMERVADDPPSVREAARDRDTAAALLEGMRAADVMAPPTDCLAPIEAELIEEGLRKEYDAEFFAATTRDASVYGGDPFVVEAGIAYGGDLEEDAAVDLLRFANRVPLVYQRGACAITDVVRSIDWRNYNLDQPGGSGIPAGPAVILVHVASTNVPFTSESKDAVANIPELEHEAELAVREVARELKRHISKRRSLAQRREKEDVIARVLPEIATKVSAVLDRPRPDIDATLARVMNNVHVRRLVEADDGTKRVTLEVRNFDSTVADIEVTDILDAEPTAVDDGADVVRMDDEWYVRWRPDVGGGDAARVTYEVTADATANLAVKGIPPEKLTIEDQ
ncbi:MAG: DNA topoisomerase VI subunit B [Halobacteriales archaeon]